jgi:crooked neck
VEALPTNCSAWVQFAELEASLGEDARARAVYEVAVAQPALDMPEVDPHAHTHAPTHARKKE